MWWKIKRWWLFQMRPAPKIGELLVFFPFNSGDDLRQEVFITGIKGEIIYFRFKGQEKINKLHVFSFLECYISKEFIESWGVKL